MLRFELDDDFFTLLLQFCVDHNINTAELRGIGAAHQVELGYYHLERQEYEWRMLPEPVEVVSMTGNIALVDDAPYAHVHAVVSDERLQCFGGHVNRLVVGPTLEVFLDVHDVSVVRQDDEATGLKLCTFPLV